MLIGFSRILVTGGAGFIGSHIVDRLLKEGVKVKVFDNLSTGDMTNLSQHEDNPDFEFIQGDITDFDAVKKAVNDVDAVFHEAALVSVTQSIEDPLRSNSINVGGTLNILKACVEGKVKRFIFASSCAVYGDTNDLPIKEDVLANPVSPYAADKLASENYVKIFSETFGLKATVLRYFNVYGSRQKDGPYCGVISRFVNLLLKNKPITIYGDGEQKRDFVNVKDVVEANLLSLTNEKACGKVYNVGTGTPITINMLAEEIQKILKIETKPIYVESRKGDVVESYCDISKIRKELGFVPKVKLQEGLKETVEFFSI